MARSRAALATDRNQPGTGVAIAFPRIPTIMTHAAWDLNKASNGRYYLGLGSQVKGHNERRYGVAWTLPAPRMRDCIGAVSAVWRAWETEEPIDDHSGHYTLILTTPNFAPRPLGLPRIPISMSAVGPAMLGVAGEVADGVRLHPFNTQRNLSERILTQIGKGLERGGRDRDQAEVISGAFMATGTDEEAVAKMREYTRFRISFYCSTRSYWRVLELHNMLDLGHKLRPLLAAGRWDEMAAMIPDDVVDLFAIVGTHDEITAKIEARYAGLADSITLFIPTDTPPGPLGEIMQDIQRIPTPFKGFNRAW
ncbi:MAG: TIGR03617 family F420-dependent LLM class oxidoreductase [Rhodospirillaceae bacterium]|jgi:probable F420-dependent oxidoreductase|nr:TIGR03617 family F420-dependent LLM class oxidoreductase [Rhodospirillaceae bacterium]